MNRLNLRIVMLLALVLSFVGGALAQTSNGTIAGVITDSTGAAVVNASVTATSIQTGAFRTTQTNGTGAYRFESVIPGTYNISITAPSFATTNVNNVSVSGSVVTSANAALKPGSKETVTVEASTEALQTENGEISHNIGTVAIENLPIQNLNPYSLALTLPGVTSVTTDDFTNGTSFSVNGLRPRSNNFLIEGQDNNDAGIHGQGLQPGNLEAVKEVNILTNAYSPEFGHGGASVSNLIFKSGTNQFHGSAWDRLFNSSLDAADKGDILSDSPKSKYRENQFGFTIGGPVVKDKLFFFASYQWDKFRSTSNGGNLTVPTAAGVATLQSLGPNPRIDTLLQAIGSVRGVANTNCIDIGGGRPCVEVGVAQRNIGANTESPEFDAKGDWLLTKNDTVSLRYIRNSFSAPFDTFNFPSQLPGFDTTQGGTSHNAGITYSHVFSPSLVNEFRASYGRIGFSFDFRPETLSNPLGTGPTTSISGLTGWGAPGGLPQGRFHNTYQLQDSLSWTKGNHFFKFGFDDQQTRVRDAVPFNFFGSISYRSGGGITALGNYIDDFSGGANLSSVAHDFGNPVVRPTLNSQNYFFMDTWKLKPNFTLDYGVRYEYSGTPGNVVPFPAINVNDTTCITCVVKEQADGSNFGPRVSFAYSPHIWKKLMGEDKTVIRAGFGMFYDGLFTNIVDNTVATSPNAVSSSIVNRTGGRGTANWSQVFATLPTTNDPVNSVVDSITPHLLSPETIQWNLNIQRELPGSFTLTTAYIGTRGLHLFGNTQLNPFDPNTGERLNPNRGNITIRDNSVDSIYHGLDVQLDRRFSKGLLLRAAYTFSKAMDDGSEVFSNGTWSSFPVVQFPSSRGTTDWGLSAFDHRQRFAISYVYAIPKWQASGFMSALAYVVNNWQISGTTSLQSGSPLNIEDGFDANGDGVGNDRPNLSNISAPISTYGIASEQFGLPPGQIFDGVAFFNQGTLVPVSASAVHWIIPASGVGNIKRNYLITPGITNSDFAIQRTIKIRERHAVDFRAEMFNVFNHGNTGVPDTVLADIPTPSPTNTNFFLNYPQTVTGHRRLRFFLKYSF